MFGAEPGDQLGYFVFGERVLETGHLLAAVFDLIGDLRRFHSLADVGQRGTLLGSLCRGTVAIGAAFLAEENGSGSLRGFGGECRIAGCGKEKGGGQGGKQRLKPDLGYSHNPYFLIARAGMASCAGVLRELILSLPKRPDRI